MPKPHNRTPLYHRLIARIRESGPLSVSEFMTLCLLDPVDGYYPTRDPLGAGGDFVTAPEISQMFGEALGLWVIQSWQDIGRPDRFNLVELGPGRGVMMSDILKVLRLDPACRSAAQVTLIEASAALQAVQAKTLGPSGANVTWVDRLEEVDDAACLIIGNEYLDCLPIRQFVRVDGIWSERRVGVDNAGDLRFEVDGQAASAIVTQNLPQAEHGALIEICPAIDLLTDHLGERFKATPGRALFIDYGPLETEFADTLQALKQHQKVDVFQSPGDTDLTARVDFARVKNIAIGHGLAVHGPTPQEAWLRVMNIETRAVSLIRANPASKDKIMRQLHRLLDAEEMGELFKVIALSSPELPTPLGFAE